ncbi:PGF-CTERM sorting domain-containing protein [Haloarcula sp. JP-L23]|uniref:PGF-CTERM sorting domain-containing protein n=1 Tax=Haloarcula sp. JP-L23 TaxID=2716717 RepID=UPI001D0554A5
MTDVTPTPTTATQTAAQTTATTTTGDSGPGFTAVVALLAVLGAAVLAVRRPGS